MTVPTHRSAIRRPSVRLDARAVRLVPRGRPASGERRRPLAFIAALLVVAYPLASGTAMAETGVAGDAPPDDPKRVVDGQVNGRSEARARLMPRWIAPRRLADDPVESAVKEVVATTVNPETDGLTERSLNVQSIGVRSADGRSTGERPRKDWREEARIVIHGEAINDKLSALTAELLTSLGAGEVERRRVGDSSEVDQIRYFDAADERMARDLADALSPEFGRVPVMDFTAYTPQPDSGLLEMWLR